MKLKSRNLTVATLAVSALLPAVAAAQPRDGGVPQNPAHVSHGAYVLKAVGENASQYRAPACGKDYSRNSVDGGFCAPRATTPIASSKPVTSTPAKLVVNDNGFAWGDAAAGAGAAFAIVLIGVGTTTAVRRHRTAGRPTRPAVTS
jgi:hypothetical protein